MAKYAYVDKHLDEAVEDIWRMLRMGWGDCFNGIEVLFKKLLMWFAVFVCSIPDDIEALGFAYSYIDTIGILTNLRKLHVSRES